MKLFARRRWPLVEGKVIDKRHIKKFLAKFDSSSVMVSVDEYLVEFPGPDGKPARVAIKAQSVRLPVKGVHVGATVPLHVNKQGTKAVFGRFEPVVSRATKRQREKERREKDEQRFKEKLGKS
jgi:hypothetical protein